MVSTVRFFAFTILACSILVSFPDDLSAQSSAQAKTDSVRQATQTLRFAPRQIGLSFSTLSGAGIHYLLPVDYQNNVKFTGFYYYTSSGNSEDSFYSLGVEYQRDIFEDDVSRVHFILGTHIDNNLSENIYFQDRTERSSYFNLGTGLGYDFGGGAKGIMVNIHVTYQLTTGIGFDQTRLGLGFGAGLGLNF